MFTFEKIGIRVGYEDLYLSLLDYIPVCFIPNVT